jgi:glutamate-1-semialdehyde 2,1-aminomutase
VEPVAANMGVVPPEPGFLEGLRRLCDAHGALLIFDEVITGFRLSLGGAQEFFGVRADLVTFGKIIGGGMPVGAYGGRRSLMELVAPCGSVYQAGTLSGNPVAMAAGLAQLRYLRDNARLYDELSAKGAHFAQSLRSLGQEAGVPLQVNQIGSLATVFFTQTPVTDFESACKSDLDRFGRWYRGLLERGIYTAPSQYEALFLSAAHTQEDLNRALEAAGETLRALRE